MTVVLIGLAVLSATVLLGIWKGRRAARAVHWREVPPVGKAVALVAVLIGLAGAALLSSAVDRTP